MFILKPQSFITVGTYLSIEPAGTETYMQSCWTRSRVFVQALMHHYPEKYGNKRAPLGSVVGWRLGPGLLDRNHASARPRGSPDELRLEAVAKSWSDLLGRDG